MIATNRSSSSRVRFLRSIGFRITIVAAVTMLLFGWVERPLRSWVYETWALDYREPPRFEDLAPELARLIADPALVESDQEFAGWLEGAAQTHAEFGLGFYVLDASGVLLHRTPDLASLTGNDLSTSTRFKIHVGDELFGLAYMSLRPIAVDDRMGGLFGRVSYSFLDEADFDYTDAHRALPVLELPPGSPVSLFLDREEAQFEAQVSRFQGLRWLVNGLVALATALVLGLLASLLLSRRIVRLVRQTENTGADGLPGPFDARGGDEIAVLSGAMNAMRTRIRDLVSGLEQRDAARSEWVAQVSHDLRTPLTSLRVCLERAESRVAEGSSDELREALQLARHDAHRLQTLAENLLEAARLEIGAPLAIEPVLPREVLRDALRSVQPLADGAGVQLSMTADGGVEDCEADGQRLVRACENLLRNAVRHASGAVEAGVRADRDGVEFWVRDDGGGFGGAPGPVAIEAARSGASGDEGASLGLLVVERVAQAHGGAVELENLDRGAEARFRIPISPRGLPG